MEKKEFRFSYYSLEAHVVLENDNLSIKQGLGKWQFPLRNLKYLYVISSQGQYMQTILAYETPEKKMKRVYINSDAIDARALELIELLVKLKPEIDIRSKKPAEAYKLKKTANMLLVGIIITDLIFMAILGIGLCPLIIHGIDKGHETYTIEELSKLKNFTTRNITVNNFTLVENYMKSTVSSSKSSTKTTTYYVPVVSEDWTIDKKVTVIAMTTDIKKFFAMKEISGVIRNVFWEGLDSKDKKFFRENIGLKLSKRSLLLETQANPGQDFIIMLIFGGIIFAMVQGIIIAAYISTIRKK